MVIQMLGLTRSGDSRQVAYRHGNQSTSPVRSKVSRGFAAVQRLPTE